MGTWMLRAALAAGGLALGGAALAPGAGAAPCAVVLTCTESTTTTVPPPPPPSTTTTTAAPQLSSADAAARLLSLLNAERAAAGLAPFTMRADVTEIAAGWTTAMANASHLAHNDAYFTKETRQRLDARMLGENVAFDGSVDAAHHALMASPPHRANILDGRFTVIGVAAQLRDRTWWVTQDFVQPASAAAPAPATAPTPAPATDPVATTAPPVAAATTAATSGSTDTAVDAEPAAVPAVAGEVLSATSGGTAMPVAVDAPSEGTAMTMRTDTASSPGTRTTQLVVAGGALLAAYALSWASASARIRCRWSPRRTSRG